MRRKHVQAAGSEERRGPGAAPARQAPATQSAREELISGNLRLVLSVIQKFSGRGENVDDLFQVGCIGLIKAIDNFDTAQNVRFSTYGVPMIAGEIRRYLRDNSSVRVSRSMRDTAYKRPAGAREAHRRDRPRAHHRRDRRRAGHQAARTSSSALDAISDPVSLFEPIYSDAGESVCVMDQLSDTRDTDESWLERLALSDAISALGEREKRILALRYL